MKNKMQAFVVAMAGAILIATVFNEMAWYYQTFNVLLLLTLCNFFKNPDNPRCEETKKVESTEEEIKTEESEKKTWAEMGVKTKQLFEGLSIWEKAVFVFVYILMFAFIVFYCWFVVKWFIAVINQIVQYFGIPGLKFKFTVSTF